MGEKAQNAAVAGPIQQRCARGEPVVFSIEGDVAEEPAGGTEDPLDGGG